MKKKSKFSIKKFSSSNMFGFVLLASVIIAVPITIGLAGGQKNSEQRTTHAATLLPGQEIWKNGVSSYLFGTNDTQEWSDDNVGTDPHKIIQASLKNAHLTLLRTFLFAHSLADGHATTDAEIDTRMQTIQNSGMQCLGVLQDITTPEGVSFAEHVVSYLGNKCTMYEFGNEDDLNGVSITTYLQQWNSLIPQLRAINPQAKFGGPVTYNDQGNSCYYGNGTPAVAGSQNGDCFMQMFLRGVKISGVMPDFVTFHWYPCDNATDGFNGAGNCGPNQAASYATVTNEVKGWVHNDLGVDVPVGITEWNFDPGSSPLGENASFMSQFTTQALQAMISSGLDFANQFDVQSYSGYCHLDMFNSCDGTDQPKAQFTALANIIAQYYPGVQSLTATPTLSTGSLTPTPTLVFNPTMTPVPTKVVTATPTQVTVTTVPTGGSLSLYINGVSSGFSSSSFGVSAQNPCDRASFVSAPCSYSVAYQGWGGISFYPKSGTIATNQYRSLEVNINTNGQPLSNFSAVILGAKGNWVNELVFNTSFVTKTLTGGWAHLSIPTSVLNSKNTAIKYVQFKNALNQDVNTVYFDDMQFTN